MIVENFIYKKIAVEKGIIKNNVFIYSEKLENELFGYHNENIYIDVNETETIFKIKKMIKHVGKIKAITINTNYSSLLENMME